MDWIDRMQIAYEAQTDRMIDEMYGPRSIKCAMCEEYFISDNAIGTKHNPQLDFCSDECIESWEEEFAHDYEEVGDWLDNQSPIYPVACTPSHMAIQKVG
jgi:hypothetical protein